MTVNSQVRSIVSTKNRHLARTSSPPHVRRPSWKRSSIRSEIIAERYIKMAFEIWRHVLANRVGLHLRDFSTIVIGIFLSSCRSTSRVRFSGNSIRGMQFVADKEIFVDSVSELSLNLNILRTTVNESYWSKRSFEGHVPFRDCRKRSLICQLK